MVASALAFGSQQHAGTTVPILRALSLLPPHGFFRNGPGCCRDRLSLHRVTVTGLSSDCCSPSWGSRARNDPPSSPGNARAVLCCTKLRANTRGEPPPAPRSPPPGSGRRRRGAESPLASPRAAPPAPSAPNGNGAPGTGRACGSRGPGRAEGWVGPEPRRTERRGPGRAGPNRSGSGRRSRRVPAAVARMPGAAPVKVSRGLAGTRGRGRPDARERAALTPSAPGPSRRPADRGRTRGSGGWCAAKAAGRARGCGAAAPVRSPRRRSAGRRWKTKRNRAPGRACRDSRGSTFMVGGSRRTRRRAPHSPPPSPPQRSGRGRSRRPAPFVRAARGAVGARRFASFYRL